LEIEEDYRILKVYFEQGLVFIKIHVLYLPMTDNNGSGEMFTIRLNDQQGFHPRHFIFNQTAKPLHTGTTSLSQSAGAVWGDRYCHPPSSSQCFVFHVSSKEIYRATIAITGVRSGAFTNVVDCVPVTVS
jgi:hypothetical protein